MMMGDGRDGSRDEGCRRIGPLSPSPIIFLSPSLILFLPMIHTVLIGSKSYIKEKTSTFHHSTTYPVVMAKWGGYSNMFIRISLLAAAAADNTKPLPSHPPEMLFDQGDRSTDAISMAD